MFGLTLPSRLVISAPQPFKVDEASNIAGWMTYEELKWLAKAASKHDTIVEIGSYQGRSTCAMAQNTKGVIYAVDDFVGPRDKQNLGLPIFELFCGNLLPEIQQGKVIPVIANHADMNLDIRPDMVFIDGSHEYEDVKRDVTTWQAKLRPGGLLCGHDAQFTQVQKALAETLGSYKVARKTTIWYIM